MKYVPGSNEIRFANVRQLPLPAVMCSLKGKNPPESQPAPRWHFLSSCQLLPGDPKCSLPGGDGMCGPALVSLPVSMAREITPPSLQIGPLYLQGSGESGAQGSWCVLSGGLSSCSDVRNQFLSPPEALGKSWQQIPFHV